MNRSVTLPRRGHRLDLAGQGGVSCDLNGPKTGSLSLLRRTSFGLEPRPAAELDFILSKAFGVPVRKAAALMPALESIARAHNAEKLLKAGFDPNEPRDARGRWTSDGSGRESGGPTSRPSAPARRAPFVQNVQDRVTPRGFTVEHDPGPNPLDPMGLNRPVLSAEMQQIANALTMIENGNTKGLNPHNFQNLPNKDTNAQLPQSTTGYQSYNVPGLGRGRGESRLVIENGTGATYYTSNHYLSFYPVTVFPSVP